jgi:hypothetical protein
LAIHSRDPKNIEIRIPRPYQRGFKKHMQTYESVKNAILNRRVKVRRNIARDARALPLPAWVIESYYLEAV